MGTNYYLRIPSFSKRFPQLLSLELDDELANALRRLIGPDEDTELHIGKRSSGWVFGLHVFTEQERRESRLDFDLPTCLSEWIELFMKFPIEDEYGNKLNEAELLGIILAGSGNVWSLLGMVPLGQMMDFGIHPAGLAMHRRGSNVVGQSPNGEPYTLFSGVFS